MKVIIVLTDADGNVEERKVSLRWLLNYVSGLVRNETKFVIMTAGGEVRYNGAKELG